MIHKPVLLHVRTYKGKGYQYAEQDPTIYHGLSGFDVTTGDTGEKSQSFSDEFGQTLCCLARENEKLCAITAAMQNGTGLSGFREEFRSRFFDVGISEEHAVTFAGGLAAGGMLPVFAVYSTFLQRAYDELIHDVSMQGTKSFWPLTAPAWWGRTVRPIRACSTPPICRPSPTSRCILPPTLRSSRPAHLSGGKGPGAVRHPLPPGEGAV